MAEDVAGPVDARALAVPDRENPIVFALAAHLRLLRAPDGGGGEILVEAGLEDDVSGLQLLGGEHELLIEPAHRGAPVARHETCGIEPGVAVARLLHQQQAGDGLGARDEDAGLGEVVFVGQRHLRKRKGRGEIAAVMCHVCAPRPQAAGFGGAKALMQCRATRPFFSRQELCCLTAPIKPKLPATQTTQPRSRAPAP